eukprot:40420_1
MITPNVEDDIDDDDNNSEPFDGATMIGGYDINEKNNKDPDAYDPNAQYDSQDGYTDNENENENDPHVYGTMVGPYDDIIEESNTQYKQYMKNKIESDNKKIKNSQQPQKHHQLYHVHHP